MNIKIFIRGTPNEKAGLPFIIESNLEYAIPYWTKRKKLNPKIYWKIES